MATVYYPAGCSVSVPDHLCDPCEEIENGRVRSIALIDKNFTFTDPTSATEWATGIQNKQIIIIPEVLGSFDGGTPVETTGYGDQQTKVTGYNFVLSYKDPNYKKNGTFYNALKFSRNYRIAYRTETQTHLSDNTVTIVPKNPVTDDLTSEVVWEIEAKFSQGDLPEPFATPDGVFQCIAYA